MYSEEEMRTVPTVPTSTRLSFSTAPDLAKKCHGIVGPSHNLLLDTEVTNAWNRKRENSL